VKESRAIWRFGYEELFAKGFYREAIQYFSSAIAFFVKSRNHYVELYYNDCIRYLAFSYYELGNYAKSIELLSNKGGEEYQLSKCYFNLGEYKKAREMALKCPYKLPDFIAESYALENNYMESLKWFNQTEDESPKTLTKALYCLDQAERNEGISNLKEIISRYPVLYTKICNKYGNLPSAKKILDKYSTKENIKWRIHHPLKSKFSEDKIPVNVEESLEDITRFVKFEELIVGLVRENKLSKAKILCLGEINRFKYDYFRNMIAGNSENIVLLQGDLDQYLEIMMKKEYLDMNLYLSILMCKGEDINSKIILERYKWLVEEQANVLSRVLPYIQTFVDKEIQELKNKIGASILQYYAPKSGRDLFVFISDYCIDYKSGLPIFDIMPEYWLFQNHDKYLSTIRMILIKAIKNASAFLKIGEGQDKWISESQIYAHFKKTFKKIKVIRHASPLWLGSMHLDIYFPDLDIAIEYMGQQHYAPVDFFGGVNGFNKTIIRDRKKKELCDLNNVKMYYIKYNDDIKKCITEITNQINKLI
jgi:tetratricopeptide (TPR) repeat protein